MTDMAGNILNRVRRLPKPTKAAQALQPLFEAVSNAMHAIEDAHGDTATENGRIEITITALSKPAQTKIVISDNGVGLTTKRFEAFCTTDTDFKFERGGKGVGRLLWLDAFESVKVSSVFDEGGTLQRREFRFRLTRSDQITDETIAPASSDATSGTIVEFSVLKGCYAAKFPAHAKRLIRYFGAHFFAEFILGRSP